MGTQYGPRPALWACFVTELVERRERDDCSAIARGIVAFGYGRTAEDARKSADALASEWRPPEGDSDAFAESASDVERLSEDGVMPCSCCGVPHLVVDLFPHGPDADLNGVCSELTCAECLSEDANEKYAEGLGAA